MEENKKIGFSEDYSENSFWEKIKNFAKMAGAEVIGKALELYYTMQNPNTPTWAKTVIIGALGYFISPIDAIPDVTPIVGFTDDLGVLTAAIATVAMYITDEAKEKAKNKLEEWFGK
ncbi:YkvA family protein [Sulfurospirillum sp. 1612]|uniref:YkvA family protein n=1 Tax=Sulfurospirillum sp. 1612 TaxID=3094835 RepID=UPI002F924BD7